MIGIYYYLLRKIRIKLDLKNLYWNVKPNFDTKNVNVLVFHKRNIVKSNLVKLNVLPTALQIIRASFDTFILE